AAPDFRGRPGSRMGGAAARRELRRRGHQGNLADRGPRARASVHHGIHHVVAPCRPAGVCAIERCRCAHVSALSVDDRRHLLRRLSFGASAESLATLEGADRVTAFERLCEANATEPVAVARGAPAEQLRERWVAHLIGSPAPLRENLTLFLHGLIGSSTEAVT